MTNALIAALEPRYCRAVSWTCLSVALTSSICRSVREAVSRRPRSAHTAEPASQHAPTHAPGPLVCTPCRSAAKGSGIPQMKSILAGAPSSLMDTRAFLSLECLVAKVLGLTCAAGAGLSIGARPPPSPPVLALAHTLCLAFRQRNVPEHGWRDERERRKSQDPPACKAQAAPASWPAQRWA